MVRIILLILLIITSCQRYEELEKVVTGDFICAQIEETSADTRTSLDGADVIWSENDRITVFNKSHFPQKYQIQDEFVGKNYGYFSPVETESAGDEIGSGMPLGHIIAYYPYADGIECHNSEGAYRLSGVMLPSEQTYAKDSFGRGTFPMVAVSQDNNITFRNICGGIKLLLKGTQAVASIRIEGNDNEKLAGAATVTVYTDGSDPAIELSGNASTYATLTCSEAVQLNESTATGFIIALPPTEFSQGFTVTVTDIDNKSYTFSSDKKNSILRSSMLVMPEVSIDNSAHAVAPYVEMGPINTMGRFGIQWWGKQYYRTPHYYRVLGNEISIEASIDCDVRLSQYDDAFNFIKYTDFTSLTAARAKDFILHSSCTYVRMLFRKDSSIPEFEKPDILVGNISEEKYYEVRSDDDGYQRLVMPIKISDPTLSDKDVLPDYGMLVLPKTYSNTGDPTRLIIYCHGAGTNYSSSITRFPTSALLPEYWLEQGYAVMDIEGNPFDNSTAHSYIPQARQTYETAYNWVVNTYNICKDGVFLGGRSLGGGMCFDLLQSSIPIIAACPLVPACNQMWYWSYMTAARKKFIFDKLGLTEGQPTWTSNKTLSEEEFQYIYENFEILMDCAPFWRGIEDLPEKDILFSIGRISANSKFDETEYNIYSKLSFKVKAPVKLFGCPEDNVVPSGRNAELMYLMLKNAGQDCELALYNSKISAPHHFELQDPQYMTQVTTKDGQTMQVPLIYIEMLEYWKKYETCR